MLAQQDNTRSERTGAPIAVMIYRRPEHLRRTLAALLENDGISDHEIHVFADGPRTPADTPNVTLSRQVAQEMLGERATYHFAQDNKGLATSIIAAVDMLTEQYGDVIVIEDDLILARAAINFLQGGLDHYRETEKVFQISAHMFDLPELSETNTSIFLPFTTSWGWATWHRAWKHFDKQANGWQILIDDASIRRRFNLDGKYDFFSMLKAQINGKRDSWAICWYWTAFINNALICYPPYSLINNTGFDGSGTHGGSSLRRFGVSLNETSTKPIDYTSSISINPSNREFVFKAIERQNGGIIGKIIDMTKRVALRVWWKN